MDEEEVLRCLAEADAARLRPELCEGRYVAVAHDPDAEADTDQDGDDNEDTHGIVVLGETGSLYEALDLIAAHMIDDGDAEEILGDLELPVTPDGGAGEDDEDVADDLEREAPRLPDITSLERRFLAYTVLSRMGPFDLVTDSHHDDAYLAGAPLLTRGARFTLLLSAAPPAQDEAWAVLELQPTGEPTGVGRDLLDAAVVGDVPAIRAALAAGADVNALDEHGMAPLHIAVAHRRPEAVTALLDAGADPGRQGEFGNAPQFAALDHARRVVGCATRIEDDAHADLLRSLVKAGAPVNAHNREGATLVDLALETVPYPEEPMGLLRERGGQSGLLANEKLGRFLAMLPYRTASLGQPDVSKVRFLLESGADTGGTPDRFFTRTEDRPALHALISGFIGRDHVPGDILLAMVDEMSRQGVRDAPFEGRTALQYAQELMARGGREDCRPVVDRLRALAGEPATEAR